MNNETPEWTKYKSIFRGARDIVTKHITPPNPFGSDDPYHVTYFLCNYTATHKAYSVPCENLRRAHRQYTIALEKYDEYLETRGFMSRYFMPSLEVFIE